MCSVSFQPGIAAGIYPERQEPRVEWLDRVAASATGMLAPWVRPQPSRFDWIVHLVNAQAPSIERLSDGEIRK